MTSRSLALTILSILILALVGIPGASAENPQVMRQIEADVEAWVQGAQTTEMDQVSFADSARLERGSSEALLASEAVCLPTCNTTDGRFLSIAGDDLQTLARDAVQLQVSVPAGTGAFEVGFFDGDSGGVWDLTGATPVPLLFTLTADPQNDGTGTQVIQTWLGSSLPDNAWADFTINTGPEAQSPAGHFFYRLRVESTDSNVPNNWSNFKIRTSGSLSTSASIEPIAFAFTGPLFSGAEGFILFPNAGSGDLTTTTYSGEWKFFVDFFETAAEFEVWDGDFDFGDASNVTLDTNDPDTPGAPFLPPWAIGTAARPEGVAFVLTCGTEQSSTGCPADDRSPGVFQRSPNVNFTVTTPDGFVFQNSNPSGNREWEQFLISTAPFDRNAMDFHKDELVSGIYTVTAKGVDLSNLNAWRFFNAVLGVCEDGTPCAPVLRPFLIGDTVFFDINGDGFQDPGEAGIEGVILNLIDQRGQQIGQTTTDPLGEYFFNVEDSIYTVALAPENFEPGGALEGLVITTAGDIGTGGAAQTDSVLDANVLTYDFGLQATGSIGDRVWLDVNGDGIQDSGESGINGVTVRLLDAGGVEIATAITSGDGNYLFPSLVAGLYTVDVDESTLPADLILTTGNEPLGVDLGQGEDFTAADFGYVEPASIGDRIWNDADNDGVQDLDEAGINGVTVFLLDENGDVVATTVTAGDGEYLFENLLPGTYTVEVDVNTLPAGFQPTFDGDGLATPHTVTVSVAAGDEVLTADFGYAPCGDCEGKVTRLTLRYDGALPAEITVTARRGPSKGEVLFSGIVQPGGAFEIVGPDTGNPGFVGTLGTEIQLFVDGVENTQIHTSCSQPIGPGLVSGDFTVLIGASRHGGPLCPVEDTGGGGDDGGDDGEDDGEGSPGTGTIGFWKTHPEAWPVNELELGGVEVSQDEALEILSTPPRGDASIILLQQLIAAKLNVELGNEDDCIEDVIDDADDWLEDNGSSALNGLDDLALTLDFGRGRGKGKDKKDEGGDMQGQALELAETLDAYNNGRLCAPHRG